MEGFKISGKKITNVEKAFLAEKGLKWCSKCKSAKSFDLFVKNPQTADGFNGTCKECNKQARIDNLEYRKQRDKLYYQKNCEVKKQQSAGYRKAHPEKILEMRKTYYSENRDLILQRNEIYRQANREKVASKQKEYWGVRIDYKKVKAKEWRSKSLEKLAAYNRNKYHTNLNYKLRCICRGIVRRMYLAINQPKNDTTNETLGYSPKQLKEHIEKQFKEGMTWDNYGDWHIDHIIPLASAKTLIEGKYLSRLENLQPLWAEENLSKGSRLDYQIE